MAGRGWLSVLGALCASLMITGAEAAAKKATPAKAEPPLMRGCTIAIASRFFYARGRRWSFYTAKVESECDAVAVGRTYLLPPLSSGGALVVQP
jgi:hypothetical protein